MREKSDVELNIVKLSKYMQSFEFEICRLPIILSLYKNQPLLEFGPVPLRPLSFMATMMVLSIIQNTQNDLLTSLNSDTTFCVFSGQM